MWYLAYTLLHNHELIELRRRGTDSKTTTDEFTVQLSSNNVVFGITNKLAEDDNSEDDNFKPKENP